MTLLGFVSNFKNHKYHIWYSCWLKWCSFSPHIQARPPCNTLWVVTVNLQHPAPVAWKPPPQQPCVWISHMSLWWSNVLSVGLHTFHQCVRKKKKKEVSTLILYLGIRGKILGKEARVPRSHLFSSWVSHPMFEKATRGSRKFSVSHPHPPSFGNVKQLGDACV